MRALESKELRLPLPGSNPGALIGDDFFPSPILDNLKELYNPFDCVFFYYKRLFPTNTYVPIILWRRGYE